MLELRNVTKVYNAGTVTEQRLFQDFSLTVEEGQFVAVVGGNGSGKTTLLNIICGSIPIEAGDVLVEGRSILKLKDYQRYASMGRVYQDPSAGTCPNLTMLENLSLADNKGKPFNLRRGVDRRRTDYYREQLRALGLGLEDKLNVKMGSLSGGQRQAVALLMATMTPLRFLILDEHTAALDPKTAEVIMALTDKVVREKRLTAVMVTHNLRYAVEYGDRILMMNQGRVALDRAGEEKRTISLEDILTLFKKISIVCGILYFGIFINVALIWAARQRRPVFFSVGTNPCVSKSCSLPRRGEVGYNEGKNVSSIRFIKYFKKERMELCRERAA